MNKRLYLVAVILTVIFALLIGEALAADTTLAAEAGMSAYANVDAITDFAPYKAAFQSIEYETSDVLLGIVDMAPYSEEYDPYVLVNSDGLILAYYPRLNADGKLAPAAKMVDVIGGQVDKTLLEKAVKDVGAAGGLSGLEVNHYNFAQPDASNLLLVAEYQADGSTFTLNVPSSNILEKSYAFYRAYEPSFTLDNEIINQVNFVLTNADYVQEIVYGTIYGHFADPVVEPGFIDMPTDITNTFEVWNRDFYAFGALALYGGLSDFTIGDADYTREIIFADPGLGEIVFDLTPSDFYKTLDVVAGEELNPTLTWTDSTAPNYEYCITTEGTTCDTSWVSTGSDTSVALSNLFYETTYYWQVRASNSTATVEADGGTWFSFTTPATVPPAAFAKVSGLLTEKIGSASKLTMTWDPSYGAYYYEYCVDTTDACIAPEVWHNVGLATTATTSDLEFDTTYYWQVRAVNYIGETIYYTEADDGAWSAGLPTRNFSKLSPTDGALKSNTPTIALEWEPTGPALSYEYCVDTTDDNACGAWVDVGSATKVAEKGLEFETTYYWQVRAVTSTGYLDANGGDWWTFTTKAQRKPTPALFKESPVDGAVDLLTTLTLDWQDYKTRAKVKADSYQYCFFDIDETDTTPISDDDTCTYEEANWIDTGLTSEATISLSTATTYYWQVRVNIGTEEDAIWLYADNDEYWSFTTAP